ncbi:MAG: GIY-YIG nuclease family protein, partial [Verrucomicrobiales bacterium]|nr:GIY-YIG nuclease family protein [Verrucomicrobiales bacterium]
PAAARLIIPHLRDRWFKSTPRNQVYSHQMQDSASAYYVYVLSNPAHRHYIGISDNPARRLAQHNSGVSQWAGTRGPWQLVWQQGPMSLSQARKLEHLLKRQKGGKGFYRITGLQPPGS